jgi:glycosyltransferase involved in cell wall biosynthesis
MRISVIISTYDQPEALERVLLGFALQTHREFELIVADDGSGPKTAAVIERAAPGSAGGIKHIRHEHRGFRKSEILNQAIIASTGDYLIFSDGDCIPRNDFVHAHARLARPGYFLSGGYLKAPARVSTRIGAEEIRSGEFADPRWLSRAGWRRGSRPFRLTRSRLLARLMDAATPTKPQFNGHNASTWREAIFLANGFEGEMGYGGLDRALGYRLRNLGIRDRQIRYSAVCIHLHHERPYKDPEGMRRNAAVLRRIVREREVRARVGIAEVQAACFVQPPTAARPGTAAGESDQTI